jgi:hypothetical protein
MFVFLNGKREEKTAKGKKNSEKKQSFCALIEVPQKTAALILGNSWLISSSKAAR